MFSCCALFNFSLSSPPPRLCNVTLPFILHIPRRKRIRKRRQRRLEGKVSGLPRVPHAHKGGTTIQRRTAHQPSDSAQCRPSGPPPKDNPPPPHPLPVR